MGKSSQSVLPERCLGTLTQILVPCLVMTLKWDTRRFSFVFKQIQMEFYTVKFLMRPVA